MIITEYPMAFSSQGGSSPQGTSSQGGPFNFGSATDPSRSALHSAVQGAMAAMLNNMGSSLFANSPSGPMNFGSGTSPRLGQATPVTSLVNTPLSSGTGSASAQASQPITLPQLGKAPTIGQQLAAQAAALPASPTADLPQSSNGYSLGKDGYYYPVGTDGLVDPGNYSNGQHGPGAVSPSDMGFSVSPKTMAWAQDPANGMYWRVNPQDGSIVGDPGTPGPNDRITAWTGIRPKYQRDQGQTSLIY